jgi:hypothetical protein
LARLCQTATASRRRRLDHDDAPRSTLQVRRSQLRPDSDSAS